VRADTCQSAERRLPFYARCCLVLRHTASSLLLRLLPRCQQTVSRGYAAGEHGYYRYGHMSRAHRYVDAPGSVNAREQMVHVSRVVMVDMMLPRWPAPDTPVSASGAALRRYDAAIDDAARDALLAAASIR